MKFFEINLLGVYIAPISLLIVAAWFVTVALRRVASCFGLFYFTCKPRPHSKRISILSSLIKLSDFQLESLKVMGFFCPPPGRF